MATILDEERKKTQAWAPAPAATTARPSNFMPDTNAVMDGVGQNLGDQLRQGRFGAAIGETARGAAAMVPALVNDVVLRPLAPVGRGIVDAVTTFAGGATASPAPAPAGPTAATPPRLGVGAPGSTGDVRRMANDFDRSKAPPPIAPQPDPLNGFKETKIGGVYRRGNAFSDAAGVNDDALWKRGQVSPQNNAAASALSMGPAARPNTVTVEAAPPATPPGGSVPVTPASPVPTATATATPASTAAPGAASAQPAAPGFGATPSNTAGAPASVGMGANQQALARMQAASAAPAPGLGAQMPSIKTSANDWETRNNLRNLRVSANSLSNDGKWGGRRGGQSPDVAAYLAAVETDNAARQGKNPMAQEMLQQLGATRRTEIQDAGATQRTGIGEQGANSRAAMNNEVQRGELGIKQGEFGIKSRSTARLEGLRDEYTRATPQRQAEIAKQIREMSGTATPEAWKGVELSGGMDSQGYRLPSQLGVVNSATGEVRMPGQGGAQLPPGMTKQVGTSGGKPVYEDASGKRFVGG